MLGPYASLMTLAWVAAGSVFSAACQRSCGQKDHSTGRHCPPSDGSCHITCAWRQWTQGCQTDHTAFDKIVPRYCSSPKRVTTDTPRIHCAKNTVRAALENFSASLGETPVLEQSSSVRDQLLFMVWSDSPLTACLIAASSVAMLASPLPYSVSVAETAPPVHPSTPNPPPTHTPAHPPKTPKPPPTHTPGLDEEEEDQSQYGRGGYYPVRVGETFAGRYQVLRKLGWGHFSTVWLCRDLQTSSFMALKVVKSAATFTETALDEIKLLKCVRDSDPTDEKRDTIVQLTDDFKASGVNGDHVCMVMEVLGQQLLKWIIKSNYRGLPLQCVRSILRQVLQGLDYLHTKCRIIHTDIKPENVLLRVDASDLQQMATEAATERLSQAQRKRRSGRCEEWQSSEEGCSSNRQPAEGSINLQPTLSPAESHTLLMEDQADQDTHTRDGPVDASRLVQIQSPARPASSHTRQAVARPFATAYAATLASLRSSAGPVDLLNPEHGHRIKIKIADLGNSCWVHKHFSEEIQTCQYRSIEVLIGAQYNTAADIWSTACMAFELATGDFLFEPEAGESYSREEDHVAHIMELLGPLPLDFAMSGRRSRQLFNRKGELRRIGRLRPWSLCDVLQQKYGWLQSEAESFTHFLLPMLEIRPEHRATAAQCLTHPWLNT
ncbi:hypothetical protein ACEWY4_013466 [Coilia grayii]|uniref:non-specific serine/threonine protein kinase n=1 Tax=Coilia grayii TaxID=363190 RepID=A0ABD1JWV5_9TELE